MVGKEGPNGLLMFCLMLNGSLPHSLFCPPHCAFLVILFPLRRTDLGGHCGFSRLARTYVMSNRQVVLMYRHSMFTLVICDSRVSTPQTHAAGAYDDICWALCCWLALLNMGSSPCRTLCFLYSNKNRIKSKTLASFLSASLQQYTNRKFLPKSLNSPASCPP